MDKIFNNRKVNLDKLIAYGFKFINNEYIFTKDIAEGELEVRINIKPDNELRYKVIDKKFQEEYVLPLMKDASGEFVGKVRVEIENIFQDINKKCFEDDIFKSGQTREIIDYISQNYGDGLEFLWDKFPDVAITRRKDNSKWYAVFFVLSKNKLKIDSQERVDVIDLRVSPENLSQLIDNKNFFEAYHMNKKHWISICLDGKIPTTFVLKLLEESYNLAKIKIKNAKNANFIVKNKNQ